MALRNQRECGCCGAFTTLPKPQLCQQCQVAGCARRKHGERCYLTHGQTARPSDLPLGQIVTGLVLSAAGKVAQKVDAGIRRKAREVERMIEETSL